MVTPGEVAHTIAFLASADALHVLARVGLGLAAQAIDAVATELGVAPTPADQVYGPAR